jgi:Ecdysteroid kinase-like family
VSDKGGANGINIAYPRRAVMVQTVAPLVPEHRNWITAAWLTSALRSTGVIAPGTRVIACAQHPIVACSASGEARDDGGGLSGPQIVRLKLAYDGGVGPAQMVVKFGNWGDKQQIPAWPLQGRVIQVVGNLRLEEQFRSEITFYKDIHPHIRGVRLPTVYYVAMVDAPQVSKWSYVLFDKRTPLRFCVLMEDLAVDNFAAVPLGESLPFARAKQALLNIAQLHAFGWQQPRLWAQLHLRPTPWLTLLRADEGQQRRQRDKFVHTNFIPTFLKLWAQRPGQRTDAHGVPILQEPDIVAMLTALNASFATWADEAAKTARQVAQTIVHGDFHGGNHLFNPHDACRVIDFQFFGTGRVADELAYFFTMSFDPAPEAEEELLHLYHHALVEAGVHAYPYEQCLHEYHVSTLTLLLGGIVRATKFLKPSTYDKMAQNRKQAELLRVGELGRARMMRRALYWYQVPKLRNTFFSLDRWCP